MREILGKKSEDETSIHLYTGKCNQGNNKSTKRNENAFCLFHEAAGHDSGYCRSIDFTPEIKKQ